LSRVPALDGLRALAVMGVLFAHTWTAPFSGGGRGVDVFFVLSGFLITSILLKRPPIAEFYVRRARRLLPALIAFLAAYLLLAPVLLPDDDAPREALFALFYSNNWSMALGYRQSGLGHTWSLSIEEQFYLLWPLLLIALKRVQSPLLWLGMAWIVLTLMRDILPDPRQAYYITPLHATGLIIGAMVAFRMPPANRGWLALGAIILAFMLGRGSTQAMWSIPLTEIATAFLISALLQPSPLSNAFAWKPVAWLGLISYGIYLWHWPVALLTRGHWWSFPATLALSVSIAALSFYSIEAYFRRPRERRRHQSRDAVQADHAARGEVSGA
jgi:peptidoglycan/LPS O-acetylase OafA/YrhL